MNFEMLLQTIQTKSKYSNLISVDIILICDKLYHVKKSTANSIPIIAGDFNVNFLSENPSTKPIPSICALR